MGTCTFPVGFLAKSRDHPLFLHAAGSLCKICVRDWLDQGADASYDTPWEPLKSAVSRAEEIQVDKDLLSMLSAPGGNGACSRSNPLIFFQFQRWRLSARIFFLFWSFGADNQGCGAAVASTALRNDLEMLIDIFESNDCPFLFSVLARRRLICQLLPSVL